MKTYCKSIPFRKGMLVWVKINEWKCSGTITGIVPHNSGAKIFGDVYVKFPEYEFPQLIKYKNISVHN